MVILEAIMDSFLQEVGGRVKEARVRKHLSQAQLAEMLGLSSRYISTGCRTSSSGHKTIDRDNSGCCILQETPHQPWIVSKTREWLKNWKASSKFLSAKRYLYLKTSKAKTTELIHHTIDYHIMA